MTDMTENLRAVWDLTRIVNDRWEVYEAEKLEQPVYSLSVYSLCNDAAHEIDRLSAENSRLVAKIHRIGGLALIGASQEFIREECKIALEPVSTLRSENDE